MTTEATPKQVINDDVDLLVLLEKTGTFFQRYRWLFVVALVLGIGSGIFVYNWLPRVYKSKLVLHSFLLTNPEQMQLVSNWSALMANREYTSLAASLNTDESTLRTVKRIKAEEIQKVFTTENPNGFYIEVTVSNNSILPELEKAFLHGLRSSEYVKAKLEMRRANLRELADKTALEIMKLDSTRNIVDKIIRGESRHAASLILDGGTINRQIIELNERLLNYRTELRFTDAVQVLQSFSAFNQPSGPKLIPWVVIGLVFFLSLAWVIAMADSTRARIKLRRLSIINN